MHFPIIPSGIALRSLYNKVKESSLNGRWKEVLSHYIDIRRLGAQQMDHTIISHVFKACLALSSRLGECVHTSLIKQGFESFSSVGNSLMDFYAKSGELGSAMDIFNCTSMKDSVSWNIILHGHLDQGALGEGLDLFVQARAFGFEPNISTLVLIIQAYRSLKSFKDGQKFQGYLIQSGLSSIISVQNSLLAMYTDIRVDYAEKLFVEMLDKDVISWSVMIRGYVHIDEYMLALEAFKHMVSKIGIEADGQIMVSVLKGCTNLVDRRIGKSIHGFVVVRGLNCDMFVGNSLVDFYSKCREIDSAVTAFCEMPHTNLVSWNSLLFGFIENEKHADALNFFALMQKSEVAADDVTLVNLLLICKTLGNLHQCKLIHARVIRGGFQSNHMAINSLIDAYAKCNHIYLSWRLFCQIRLPDVVTWSTMISGFTHCGMPDEAITLYCEMHLSQQTPNPVTLLNLLEACALSAEIVQSKSAHGIAIRMGLASDVIVGTAILDMYSKCGAIGASRRVFDRIPRKSVVSWSAIIGAYGLNGFPRDALALLSQMEVCGLKPNAVTALSVLSACCHGGLVYEGISVLQDLKYKHGVELDLEHYSCLVDLLARAGNLDDASELIKSIPAGASAWGAVLSACRNYDENGTFGRGAVSQVLELEPMSSAAYLLASNVYARGGSWTDARGMRCLMKERGVKITAGYSLIHINNKAHTFTAGEKYHSVLPNFYPVLQQLHLCMQMDGGS